PRSTSDREAGHVAAAQPDPPRCPQERRRARRHLLARGPALARFCRGRARQDRGAHEVDGFPAVDAQGAVTVYSGKVDLGTGVRTALTQIVAKELDVRMARIAVIQGDTALTPDQGLTAGSLSIQNGGMQLRQAAATARRALLKDAADRLDAKPGDLSVGDGVVTAPSGKSLSYGELAGGHDFALKLDKEAPVKAPQNHQVVGRPIVRLDIPDKVTGRFTYMQDFRVPDMLHGRVVRPPAIGATLTHVDEGSVRDMRGVRVLRDGNFLGVVADDEWSAIKAMRRLKASWSSWDGLPEQSKLREHVRLQDRQRGSHQHCRRRGNGTRQRRQAAQGDLRFRHSHAWLDRPVLRHRRHQGRQAHLLDAVAGDAQSQEATRGDARHGAGDYAHHKAVGRRRTFGGGGAGRAVQRGVRRDRRAAALGAVHARQGARGDPGRVTKGRVAYRKNPSRRWT